jgi:hypothetical protein
VERAEIRRSVRQGNKQRERIETCDHDRGGARVEDFVGGDLL